MVLDIVVVVSRAEHAVDEEDAAEKEEENPFDFQRTSLAGLALDSQQPVVASGRAPLCKCRTPSRHHLEPQDRRDYTPELLIQKRGLNTELDVEADMIDEVQKVQKRELEIKWLNMNPESLDPTEYTTDDEDMITYDVEAEELEPNAEDKFTHEGMLYEQSRDLFACDNSNTI
ncbi:hypothetical protein TNCV_177881 [Trichonephila clavipes]|nr:hypothetical protein TNCV_177881 [Trichonephila clavipes]